ncbi:S41 family peptidase [Parapedobacter deserti]|uniref:S41 family peptidase n=1 Tax=Parapedobacter deserti TaxID=1912957 RepID=A0ABV7JRP5_9SPHI
MSKYFILTLSILLVLSCQNKKQWTHNDFFEQAFNIIEERSIKKSEIDWEVLKRTVTDSISHFQNNEDVYRAIGYIVSLIDDGHSVFVSPQTPNNFTADALPIPDIDTKIIDEDIAYIKLTGFIANVENSRIYSRRIRESLYELDRSSTITGWIIDLRENMGGMASMMPLGLAPMFQDSLIGYWMNNKGEYFSEYCTNEYFRFEDRMVEKNSALNFDLLNKDRPIAVLMSDRTASAGESLAASFKFQNNTMTFGTPTKGLTSALELMEFNSNAKLFLATMYLCSRDKKIIDRGLNPDVACSSERAYELAIKWLKLKTPGDSAYLQQNSDLSESAPVARAAPTQFR